MTSMPSGLTTRETNRLHRWAMWRMTVNEGIINCIRDNGTTRVIYPDSSSDTNSLGTSEVPDFHEFPFITPEQMSLARKLNLREKYGSNHGLSDDAYFIFGLPRINIGKDIPEVTSTGTRSVYESFSELGDAGNTSSRGIPTADNNGTLNMTYSELGPTPDAQSLASHDDMEVQKINGYREEGWKNQPSPVPRLNLYSIQEELNNNTGEMTAHYSSNRYPDREMTNRYSSNPYQDRDTTNPYSSHRYQETMTTNRHRPTSYRNAEEETANRYLTIRYQEEDTHNLSSRYLESERANHTTSSIIYPERERSAGHFTSNRGYQEAEPMPKYSVKEAIHRYESVSRDASVSSPVYYDRQTSNRSSSDRFNRNIRSPPQSPRQDIIYPPFSNSRQNSFSPTRRSFSPLPSSPRQNYSPLPTSPMSFTDAPDYSKQSGSPVPPMSPRKSSVPSSGSGQGAGSPGYASKMRPTRLLSDGDAERLKRQAYYDWSTPTTERYMLDFGSPQRYS